MSNFRIDLTQILYACDKCCTKLSYKGEPCPRCHNGKGEQVDPVPRETEQDKIRKDMCAGIPRKVKRPRNFYRDVVDDNM